MLRRAIPSGVVLGMLCLASCSSRQPAEDVGKPPTMPATNRLSQDVAQPPSAVQNRPGQPGAAVPLGIGIGSKPAAAPFQDEPAAHALYNQMIEAMRKAKSLSYVSHYEIEGSKGYKHDCTYRAWLKKPNYFRVEAEANTARKKWLGMGGGGSGILVGDGNTLWIYWPNGRFKYGLEDAKNYEKTRLTSLYEEAGPAGRALHRSRDRLSWGRDEHAHH